MALSPINYSLNAADPAERVLQGAQFGQGLIAQAEQRGLAQEQNERAQAAEGRAAEMFPLQVQRAELGLQEAELGLQAQRQQIEAQRAQMQRAQAFRQGWSDLIAKGGAATIEDFDALNAQFPEQAQATMEYFENLDERRQRPLVSTLAQAATALKAGNVEAGMEVARNFADAARASGDVQLADMADGAVALAEANPDAALAQIGTLLSQVDPKLAKTVLGSADGTKVQRSIPVGDGSAITLVMSDGTTKVLETATNKVLTGADADAAVAKAQSGEVSQTGDIARARREATLGADIELGREAAAEAAAGTVLGRSGAESQLSARQTITSAQDNIALLQSVIDSPALEGVTGLIQGRLPARGQAQQDLLVKIDQIKGQAFLQAFESLKGAGAITEVEGRAATQAIARLDRAQSAEEFRLALGELQEISQRAIDRAQETLQRDSFTQVEEQARRFGVSPEEAQFVFDMQQAAQRGERPTPEQQQRLQEIRQKMVAQ